MKTWCANNLMCDIGVSCESIHCTKNRSILVNNVVELIMPWLNLEFIGHLYLMDLLDVCGGHFIVESIYHLS